MLFGTADLDLIARRAPRVEVDRDFALEVGQVDWLQLSYELSGDRLNFDLLPPGLHPTSPLVATLQLWRARGGALGAFGLAQLRITSRAGMRIRAYLVHSVIDGAQAADTLTRRFGYGPQTGTVTLRRRSDRIEGAVAVDGRTVFDGALLQPQAVEASAIQHITNMNPAVTPDGLTLLQVDPQFDQPTLQRGDQRITAFDAGFWHVPGRTLKYPVTGVAGQASVSLPPILYTQDPQRAQASA